MKNPLTLPFSFLTLVRLLVLGLCLAGTSSLFAAEQLIDRIVAIVNQSVITQNQLNIAMEDAKKALQASGAPLPENAVLQKEVLDQLIDSRLELQAAKESGVEATPEETAKAIQQIADQNGLTVDDLYSKIRAQGLDVERWRKDIHDQLLIQKVQQQEVGSSLSISKEEVDAFEKTFPAPSPESREYHLKDFLVPLPDKPSPAALAQAKKQAITLISQLRQKKMLNLSHIKTHDFGWLTMDDMPSAFVQTVPQMKEGGISSIIRTGNGLHVLQLAGLRDANSKSPVRSREEEAKQALFEQKYQKALTKWIALLRNRATVHVNPLD